MAIEKIEVWSCPGCRELFRIRVRSGRVISHQGLHIKNRGIEELGLSVRACNLLIEAEIMILSDLLNQTKENLLAIWGFGSVALQEVIDALELIGLSLAESE